MSYFWGGVLILFGALLLLRNTGIVTFNVWGVFWPLVLILLGVQALLSFSGRGRVISPQDLAIPLGNANQADIHIQHGAGRLNMQAGSDPTVLVSGNFYGGVENNLSNTDGIAHLSLRAPSNAFMDWPFFNANQGFTWDVLVNPDLPLVLDLQTGASESNIDMRRLKVTDFRLSTGASSTTITLPENAGQTRGRLSYGAAAVNILVPDGVAARIEINSGLFGKNIDTHRFVQRGNVYESPDFSAAANRVDLLIESGMGSVEIH
jgi:hypothetical protein